MPISSVILRLDDIPMAGDVGGLSWSETLLQPRLRSLTEDGWCILEKTFHGRLIVQYLTFVRA